MYREKIVNVTTGEEIFRDYTEEEIAAVEASKKEMEEWSKSEASKRAAKASARNKLAAIGLTEEEVAAL